MSTVPAAELFGVIDRALAEMDLTRNELAELLADRFGERPNTWGKRLRCRQCASCRKANGHRGPSRATRSRPRHIDEATLDRARRLYIGGLSMRQVAAAIFEATTYASEASCHESLHRLFRRRGWPLRPQRAVTAARNYRHGRGGRDRDEGAYRRFLREQGRGYQGAYRPKCAGAKTQAPGKGKPCSRPAMAGSDFCQSHDPERQAARAEHMARMRATARGVGALDVAA